MRHRKKGSTLGREKAPREMMLRNLASSVFIHESIITTKAKAKAVQPIVERLITTAKAGDLTARRSLLAVLPQDEAVTKALAIADRYQDRQGGYTRLTNLGPRQGDGAEQARLELV